MTRRRVASGVALLLTALVVLGALPGLAAAETRAGGSIVVAEGETVNGLEAFGGSVVVRGTVDGNLVALGGDVTVAETGRVTGDASGAAGSVTVAGVVEGDLSAAAGEVSVTERGTVEGAIEVGAGTLRIDGTIGGDVTAGAETIVLGDAASIGGDLTYDGTLRGDRTAVAGTIVRDDSIRGPYGVGSDVTGVADWLFGVYGFLVNLVLGAILLLVVPRFSRSVAESAASRPVRAGFAGLLALFGIPLLLVLVALTVVGIPLTVVGLLLFAVLAWFGTVYGRFAVGTWLLSLAETENRWAALVVGFLVVAVAVRVPVLGWLVNLLVFLLGFGALVTTLVDRRRGSEKREGAAAAADGDAEPA
jgi:cytoskeletal protein CcmA (bactofilin family)